MSNMYLAKKAAAGGTEVYLNGVKQNVSTCNITDILGEWLNWTTLPYNFYGGQVVILAGEIHILGGPNSDTYRNHYKWNGSSWVSVSTLPYDFYAGSAVVYNGEIHILGGSWGGSYTKKHYKWNGSSWVSVSTLPYDFYAGSAVVYNDEIHILGGANASDHSHCKWNGSSWITVSRLPNYQPSSFNAFIYEGDLHYIYGTTHYKWDGSSWTSVSTLPVSQYFTPAVVFDDKIYLLGADSKYTKCYVFDGVLWSLDSELSYSGYRSKSIAYNNAIYQIGGNGGNGNLSSIRKRSFSYELIS